MKKYEEKTWSFISDNSVNLGVFNEKICLNNAKNLLAF